MKKTLFLIPLLALAACGNSVAEVVNDIKESTSGDFDNGTAVPTTAATIESFSKLAAMGPDNVIFKTGDTFSIVAEGDPKVVETLRYVIKDGRLAIGRKTHSWGFGDDEGATITVTAPSLSAISLVGSGDMTADRLSGEDVKVSVAGSGNLKVADVASTKLKGSIAGSGDVEIAGKVTSADYSIAGSGNVEAAKLVATDAKISIAGSGDANVNATGTVKANIAGSGNVNVTGGANCSTSSVGSGEVNCS